MKHKASYIELFKNGELAERAIALKKMLTSCCLCPHECHSDREKGQVGFCKASSEVLIASAFPHHGNEKYISGTRGSGNIFFTFCNSHCDFCQNFDISQYGEGKVVSVEGLAHTMLYLQSVGCHNLDLVTPQHYLPQTIEALILACEQGFDLPIVYNTNGYESVRTLNLLEGIIDVYLPDFKFADSEVAKTYTKLNDYADRTYSAIKLMYEQVGRLQRDENGIAFRGLVIRHLVLPDDLGNSRKIMEMIAKIDPEIDVNIMSQFHPAYKSEQHESLRRRIHREEFEMALRYAMKAGLKNIWSQNDKLV